MFCSQCCGHEKWGDWRPHLAVMLSNETGTSAVWQKAIVTMGDSLGIHPLTYWQVVTQQHACWFTVLLFSIQPPEASYTLLMCATWQPALPLGCLGRRQRGWFCWAAATGELWLRPLATHGSSNGGTGLHCSTKAMCMPPSLPLSTLCVLLFQVIPYYGAILVFCVWVISISISTLKIKKYPSNCGSNKNSFS